AMEKIVADAATAMKNPRAIAVFAYHVAGWIGESANARIGLRARRANAKRLPGPRSAAVPESPIPDRANVVPPGIQADANAARISSRPVARTAAPITTPSVGAESRRRRAERQGQQGTRAKGSATKRRAARLQRARAHRSGSG